MSMPRPGVEEDQGAVIGFLSRPLSHCSAGCKVRRIRTHFSEVFLVGGLAFKLKRAIRYGALDYRSLALREAACRAELDRNRRTAPMIYRGVRRITREADGSLAFDGAGHTLDWVVVMQEFPQSCLFEHMARRRRLTLRHMDALGAAIAAYHSAAPPARRHGTVRNLLRTVDDTARGLQARPGQVDGVLVRRWARRCRIQIAARRTDLERRRMQGFVRRVHGDLRLANICLIDGQPVLFDCIEFSDRVSCIDVLFDLAFVLVDLEHRGLARLAQRLLQSYAATAGEPDRSLLRLFMSMRAGQRAESLASKSMRTPAPASARRHAGEARALLEQALLHLDRLPDSAVAGRSIAHSQAAVA